MVKDEELDIEKSTNQGTKSKSEAKFIIYAIFLIVILIIFAISLTYAYFSRNVTKNGDDPQTDFSTGVLDVDFLTSQYISNSDAVLIYDDEAYELGDKSTFSVTRSNLNTVEQVYYTVSLVDIDITDNLKSEYLKWRLYDTTEITATTEALSEGDFLDIEDNKIELHNTKIALAKNVTHNFTLLIWLSNDDAVNQNNLLEGTIKAKIEVTAVNS